MLMLLLFSMISCILAHLVSPLHSSTTLSLIPQQASHIKKQNLFKLPNIYNMDTHTTFIAEDYSYHIVLNFM